MKKTVAPTYDLKMNFNAIKVEGSGEDLSALIVSLAPAVLKTKVVFEIKNGDTICNKIIFLKRGRMIFKNKTWREIFIRQLIFKPIALNGN